MRLERKKHIHTERLLVIQIALWLFSLKKKKNTDLLETNNYVFTNEIIADICFKIIP